MSFNLSGIYSIMSIEKTNKNRMMIGDTQDVCIFLQCRNSVIAKYINTGTYMLSSFLIPALSELNSYTN